MSKEDRVLALLRCARVVHSYTDRTPLLQGLIYGEPHKKKHLRALDTPTPTRYKKVLPQVPYPGEAFTISELDTLKSLVLSEGVHNHDFIMQADEDFVQIFRDLCEDLGVPFDEGAVDEILEESRILLTKLKFHYNRPRPYQVAEALGVPFKPISTKTGKSPSYPSGHTVQARLLAHLLSQEAPEHKAQFDELAWKVSWSRCQGGVHWPSDLYYGDVIANHLLGGNQPTAVVLASALSLQPDYGSMGASLPRVVAKYKKKREVPKAEGKGTTTVYEYSDRQVARRHREKAEQVEKLRKNIGDLREKVRSDLTSKDPKKRLTALAVALMDETYERVGNSESADERGHYGVTTWQVDHVTFSNSKATLDYTGKSGVKHTKEVTDAKVVKALRDAVEGKSKSEEILCGEDCNVTARDVNEYLDQFGVTAKDLRGYHANREMQERLKAVRKKGPKLPEDKKEREEILKEEFQKALEGTSDAVGHEAATLRSQYLVPGMEDSYLKDGTVIQDLNVKAFVVATKSDAEKEDEAAEGLIKKQPKYRPPRKDLKRRRLDDEGEKDPDAEQDGKDRSHNWKDIGASVRVAYAYLVRKAESQERKPGEVWRTDKGFRAIPQGGGDTRQFDTKPEADAYAKGEPTDGKQEDKPQDDAKGEKEKRKSRSPEEVASSLLGKGSMPEDFQKSLKGWLDRSKPEDREAFAQAFEAGLQGLVDKPPRPSDVRKSRKPELYGNSPEEAALSAAKALYAERVTFNPFHGMSGSGTKSDGEPNTERAKASYQKYKKYNEFDREEMLDLVEKALQEEKEGSARHRDLEAEREALLLHRVVKGGVGDMDAGLATVAKVLSKSGNEEVLLGTVSDFTGAQGVRALQSALENMSDDDLIETFQDNPSLEPLTEVLSGKSSGPFRSQMDAEGAALLRRTLINQVVSSVVLAGPLGSSLEAEDGSKVDMASRVAQNPSVKKQMEAIFGALRGGKTPGGEVLQLIQGLGKLKAQAAVQEAHTLLEGDLTKIEDPILRARALAIDNGEDPTAVLEAEMAKGLEEARKEREKRDREREQQMEKLRQDAEQRQKGREKAALLPMLSGYDFTPWS